MGSDERIPQARADAGRGGSNLSRAFRVAGQTREEWVYIYTAMCIYAEVCARDILLISNR